MYCYHELLPFVVEASFSRLSFAKSTGATPLACAIGGAGGEDGDCATLLRSSGGLERLVEDIVRAGSILDVPQRRPRKAIDDMAENLGRIAFAGQF